MENQWQRIAVVFAVVVTALAVLVPLAVAQSGPGQVASKLGSPDPREHAQRSSYVAGLVPMRLGSQDPRDTARATGVSFTPPR